MQHARLGGIDHRANQVFELNDKSLYGAQVKQIGVVLQLTEQQSTLLLEFERHVEHGGFGVDGETLKAQATGF